MNNSSISSNKSELSATDQLLIWIHCNKCFELFIKKQNKFFLLSCYHVLCGPCFYAVSKENNTRYCLFCKKSVNCKIIDNNLPLKYKRYFHPYPWKNISNLQDVIPFQIKQRVHFSKGIEKIKQTQIYFEQEVMDMKEKVNKIETAIKKKENEKHIWELRLQKTHELIEADSGLDSFHSIHSKSK